MRKYFLPLIAFCTFLLVGCLETTQDVTINDNGSGTIAITTDMSAAMEMLKAMGGDKKEMEELNELNIDSSFNMKEGADSIPGLTDEEKKMMRTGTFNLKAKPKENIFVMRMSFPFQSLSQVDAFRNLSTKIISEVLKDLPGTMGGDEGTEDTDPGTANEKKEGSIDDYYTTEYKSGEITRKLNKDKYDRVGTDESMKSLQEAAEMGVAIKSHYVFNLPRPAKSIEGKNAKLSDDKKKVTISGELKDFFDYGEAFEFKIKY